MQAGSASVPTEGEQLTATPKDAAHRSGLQACFWLLGWSSLWLLAVGRSLVLAPFLLCFRCALHEALARLREVVGVRVICHGIARGDLALCVRRPLSERLACLGKPVSDTCVASAKVCSRLCCC